MRLICPNCDAQYEVPTEVIPVSGRDVQCSNCGHVWFQAHPDAPDAEPPAPTPDAAAPADPDADEEADPDLEMAPARHGEEDDAEDDDADDTPADGPAPAASPARSMDPSVAQVLREEAEREARRRRAESGPIESQPDLGLDTVPETERERERRQARERMARIRGSDTPADRTATRRQEETGRKSAGGAGAPEQAASRSELLPDIDEINQSLRAADERKPIETPQGRAVEQTSSGGFLRGFAVTVLLVALLVVLYLATPRIVAAVPDLTPALRGYVGAVDEGRLWLDRLVGEGRATLDGLMPEGAEETGG